MADNYYVEPGSYPAYTATPPDTATAYDGDGLDKGLAVPAYVSIDLTAYTASAGNTVTIGGAVLTCVASGASTNQFNAASGATLASNLAAAIIASTWLCNAAATGWNTPQLRNACYASASGAILTIQTRAGSAVYNSNTLWKVVSSGLTGGAQLDNQMANGVSGAWGYLYNDNSVGTIWPSAQAVGAYGVWRHPSTPANAPIAGPCGLISVNSNIVHIKGNGYVHYGSTDNVSSNVTVTIDRDGYYLFDDGTIWPGATAGSFFRARQNSVYLETYRFATFTGAKTVFTGRTLGAVTMGSATQAYRGKLDVSNTLSTELVISNILFDVPENGGANSWVRINYHATAASSELHVQGCKWQCPLNLFFSPIVFPNSNYASWGLYVEDCIFDFSTYAGAPSYLINLTNINSSSNTAIAVCRNLTYIGAVKPTVFGNNTTASLSLLAENCSNFIVNQNVGYVGAIPAPSNGESPSIWCIQQGVSHPQQFRHETALGVIDYDPDGAYPYCNSSLPDGTAWSIRAQWSAVAATHRLQGVEVIRRQAFVTQANMSNVALELLFESAASPKYSHFGLVVSYTRASDGSRTVKRHNYWQEYRFSTTDIPTAGALAWTKAGSYATFVARKLSLALGENIAQNTMIDVKLVCYGHSGTTYTYFINPEPTLS